MTFVAILGVLLVLIILWEAFEFIVLPRTVKRAIRLSGFWIEFSFWFYARVGNSQSFRRRSAVLAAYAPITLVTLIALWQTGIVTGFALIHWGLGERLSDPVGHDGFISYLYFSGVTMFTVGYGDVVPTDHLGRMLAVLESGIGLGFLALIIGYVPVIYSAFSRRETTLLLLDSKAGSDPKACEMLRRHADAGCMEMLADLLKDWEIFGAQLLEGYLSYPILSFYRSQHDDQSWLRSLTAVMDVCALVNCGFEDDAPWAARLRFQATATFAMLRHVVVDLAYILDAEPEEPSPARLDEAGFEAILQQIDPTGIRISRDATALLKLRETRLQYEPYVQGLGQMLIMEPPLWVSKEHVPDNWQTSAWDVKHF